MGKRKDDSVEQKDHEIPIRYTKINPTFKLVFIAVLVVVLVCLGISTYLGVQTSLSDGGKTVLESSLTVFKMGAGALFGLLGGKVLP